jgi:hypothetical protein
MLGLIFAASNYMSGHAMGHPLSVGELLVYTMLRFWSFTALTPVIIGADTRLRKHLLPPGRMLERLRSWAPLLACHGVVAGILATSYAIGFVSFWWIVERNYLKPAAMPGYKQPASFGEYLGIWTPSHLLVGIILYEIILTFHYAIEYYDKYRDERVRSALLEARAAQAELQALKMQLQPHFLFNALNSISALTLEHPRAAVRMIARLGDFLRKTIDNNGAQEVSLQDEIEFLRCYLEIEQVRFRDRLQVTFDTEPAALRGQVPNLILQPIVENAIKHGIAPTMEAGRIQVRARCNESWLEVQVENDGPAAVQPGAPLREGVGVGNTRERLHQLYRDAFQLSLDPRPEGGAVMTLRLPYRIVNGAPGAV